MATILMEDRTGSLVQEKKLWHDSAPGRVIQNWSTTDLGESWSAWQGHLSRRKRPVAPSFLKGKKPPILWAWPTELAPTEVAAEVSAIASRVDNFLGVESFPSRLSHALSTVAAAYALPELAAQLPADVWWKLADSLCGTAIEAQQMTVNWEGAPEAVLRQQLLAGELPLALGYLFPELRPLRALRKSGRAALSEALVELTDGQGTPHTRLLPVMGPLWACWTRARWLGERLKSDSWSKSAETQYEWFVRFAIRWVNGDGRPALAQDGTQWPNELFAMALDLAGNADDFAAASEALSARVLPDRADFDDDDLPETSLNSEWASLTVLASGWSKSEPRISVTYADEPLSLELLSGNRRLLTGQWTSSTTCDGKQLHIVDDWVENCWQSDEDCDYLELGAELSNGMQLERQFLLSHQDKVLYVADMVISEDALPHKLQHTMRLPVGPDVHWQGAGETRDGVLVADRPRAAVIPLGLQEWQCDPRGGRLEYSDGHLVLTEEIFGRALCCPLFFDLKPRRAGKERTWRQLTVGQELEITPPDEAVAYRIQSASDQWLIYRSLAPAANRTMLGQNFSSEFFAGRFLASGETDEWIEIEAQ